MKKIFSFIALIFCAGNLAMANIDDTQTDPPGFFAQVDCVQVAMELYDVLINSEIDLETAAETAFVTLVECEDQN